MSVLLVFPTIVKSEFILELEYPEDLILVLPATSNVLPGEVVPIPIFPPPSAKRIFCEPVPSVLRRCSPSESS